MSCDFCKNADFGSYRADIERMANSVRAYISFAGGASRFEKEKQFNFCPVCGEDLRKINEVANDRK